MHPEYREDVLKMLDSNNYKYLLPVYFKTLEFIKDLKSKGYNVYLLTDILEDTIEYMIKAVDNFESMFDGIVYSCRVGMTKREDAIFEYMLDKFNIKGNETLFLDDTLSNLKRAEKFGIMTYRFLDPEKDIEKVKNILNENK